MPKEFGFSEAILPFIETKIKTSGNSERRGTADIILSGCRMMYGDRCDIDRISKDTLLPRLLGRLIAFNDWTDVGTKAAEGSKGREMLEAFHQRAITKFEQYFAPTGDSQEDARRGKIKEFLELELQEVTSVERELNDEPVDTDVDSFEKIRSGRELVNGIETLMNIRVCVDGDMFAEKKIDTAVPSLSIADLTKKYHWLISPTVDEKELNDDERKARALFFSSMAGQMETDMGCFKGSVCFL